jgi:hypothetical protein
MVMAGIFNFKMAANLQYIEYIGVLDQHINKTIYNLIYYLRVENGYMMCSMI